MKEFDVSLIDWPSAVQAAGKRLRVRTQPLLRGVLLEAYLSDHPSLTPSARMAGNAMIELHKMLDPDTGTLSPDLEAIPAVGRARKLRTAIAHAEQPLQASKEADMGRFYAHALSDLMLELLEQKGFRFVVSMGQPRAVEADSPTPFG